MNARTLEAGGTTLVYEESGSGPSVVFIHGTAATGSAWRETVDALRGEARTIAYDRRAYGRSGAPEPFGGTTVEEQAEDAAGLIAALDAAPTLVCGHDLGGVVCLDLLRRHPRLVHGAVVIEPPLLSLWAEGPEALGTIRELVEEGARHGGPAGAVDAYLAGVGGPAVFDLLGSDRLEAVHGSARAFAADLAAGPTWQFGRRELRAIGAPVTVMAGTRSPAMWRSVASELASLLAAAELRLAEAGHFVPLEAPDQVAAAIRARLAA